MANISASNSDDLGSSPSRVAILLFGRWCRAHSSHGEEVSEWRPIRLQLLSRSAHEGLPDCMVDHHAVLLGSRRMGGRAAESGCGITVRCRGADKGRGYKTVMWFEATLPCFCTQDTFCFGAFRFAAVELGLRWTPSLAGLAAQTAMNE